MPEIPFSMEKCSVLGTARWIGRWGAVDAAPGGILFPVGCWGCPHVCPGAGAALRCPSPGKSNEIQLEVELEQNSLLKHLEKLEKSEACSGIKGLAPNPSALMETLPGLAWIFHELCRARDASSQLSQSPGRLRGPRCWPGWSGM